MNRHIRLLLTFSILCAPPLAAGERYVSNTSTPTAVETVNWTTGISYAYDGSGRIRQMGEDRFAYDKAGRLVQAQTNGVTRVYQYDAFGNRIACTHEPGKPAQGDCQFDMKTDSATNRVQGIRYDAAGNVETFMGHTYTYDAVSMPVRDAGAGLPREFIYTADDERLATSSGATWNWTIRDLNGKVLRELSSSNGPAGAGSGSWTWKRDYVYRDGRLLASTQVLGDLPVTYHYHLDHLGTPRRITDQHDRTAGFHDYFAFGPEISGGLTEPAATKLQYTGHERDKTGGGEGPDTLDYMHARYYSPVLGRFLTLDPAFAKETMGRPQMWNRYAYVANDPVNLVDPTGKLLQAHASPCSDTQTDCYTRLQAFDALKQYVGRNAAKYLQMDKNGNVTLKGISARGFARLGYAAAQVGSMIRHTTSTAHFALSNDPGTLAKGGGRSDPVEGGFYVRLAPSALPTIAGGVAQTMDTMMAHEFGHAIQGMYRISPDAPGIGRIDPRYANILYGIRPSEGFAVWAENLYRAEHGLEPRTYYWYGPDGDHGEDYIPPP